MDEVFTKSIEDDSAMLPIRHPDGHGIDCRINEERGVIEIVRGKCVTILSVPPGKIRVFHRRKPADIT